MPRAKATWQVEVVWAGSAEEAAPASATARRLLSGWILRDGPVLQRPRMVPIGTPHSGRCVMDNATGICSAATVPPRGTTAPHRGAIPTTQEAPPQ